VNYLNLYLEVQLKAKHLKADDIVSVRMSIIDDWTYHWKCCIISTNQKHPNNFLPVLYFKYITDTWFIGIYWEGINYSVFYIFLLRLPNNPITGDVADLVMTFEMFWGKYQCTAIASLSNIRNITEWCSPKCIRPRIDPEHPTHSGVTSLRCIAIFFWTFPICIVIQLYMPYVRQRIWIQFRRRYR